MWIRSIKCGVSRRSWWHILMDPNFKSRGNGLEASASSFYFAPLPALLPSLGPYPFLIWKSIIRDCFFTVWVYEEHPFHQAWEKICLDQPLLAFGLPSKEMEITGAAKKSNQIIVLDSSFLTLRNFHQLANNATHILHSSSKGAPLSGSLLWLLRYWLITSLSISLMVRWT